MSDPDTNRGYAKLGPFTVDGETLYVRRHGPSSAPGTLYRANGRLWELLDAYGTRLATTVLDNDASDEAAIKHLIG